MKRQKRGDVINCLTCDKEFIATNYVHKFCSNSCKSQSFRERHGISHPFEVKENQSINKPIEANTSPINIVLENTKGKPIEIKITIT